MTANAATARPVAAPERVAAIDIVRGLALFGVLQVNLVTEFRVCLFAQFLTRHTDAGTLNHVTDDVLAIAVFSKAFALFSFLFGVGLGAQYERALAAGRPFTGFAVRRLLVLLGIGLTHLLLIWNGDILTAYALVGLVAVPFMRCKERTLLILSAIALVAYACPIPYPEAFNGTESIEQHVANANRIYGQGSFVEVARFRVHELRHIAPLVLGSMPRTLGLYFLGVVAWRRRLFHAADGVRTGLRVTAVCGVLAGGLTQLLTFGAGEGWLTLSDPAIGALDGIGQVALALGYAAAIILATRQPRLRRMLEPFGYLGRAALSNYLTQSVLFGLLCYGYGLGLYGRLGPAAAAGLGTVVYAAQVRASQLWFTRYRFGPVEWVWRSLTYGTRQPMRRSTLSSAPV